MGRLICANQRTGEKGEGKRAGSVGITSPVGVGEMTRVVTTSDQQRNAGIPGRVLTRYEGRGGGREDRIDPSPKWWEVMIPDAL